MILTELQSLVAWSLTGREFYLREADWPAPNLRRLFKDFFPDGRIELSGAEILDGSEEAAAVVTGYLRTEFFGRTNLKTVLTLRLEGGVPALHLQFTNFLDGWKFSDGLEPLRGTILDELNWHLPEVTLDSERRLALRRDFQLDFGYFPDLPVQDDELHGGLHFRGQLLIRELPPALAWFYNSAGETVEVAGPIELRRQPGTDTFLPKLWFRSAAPVADFELIGKTLPLELEFASILDVPREADRRVRPRTFGRIVSRSTRDLSDGPLTVTFSGEFYNSAMVFMDFSAMFRQIESATANARSAGASLGDLAELIGLTDGGELLPNDLPILNTVELERIGFDIQPFRRKLTGCYAVLAIPGEWPVLADVFGKSGLVISRLKLRFFTGNPLDQNRFLGASVTGRTSVAGTDFDVFVSLPDLNLSVVLGPEDVIDVAGILEEILDTDIDLPDLTCTQFILNADLRRRTFSLACRFQTDWTIDCGVGSLTLTNLELRAQNGLGSRGRIYGRFESGGTAFFISGQSAGRDQGWDLEAATLQGDIRLTSIVREFAELFGVDLPDALPDISAESVEINFNTKSRELSLRATVNAAKLPFGGDAESKTRIYLDSRRDPQSRRKQLSGHFESDLNIGDALFLVRYEFGPQAKLYRGEWRTVGDESLSPLDVLRALGIRDGLDVPEELDVQLIRAGFEYEPAHRRFTFSAASRSYGDAFLTVGTDDAGRTAFVFGLDFPPNSRLSDLPVVGRHFRAANFLNFQRAALMISGGNFSNYRVPQLPPLTVDETASSTGGTRPVQPVGGGANLELSPGLSLAAVVDLAEGDARAKNLAAMLPAARLTVQLSFARNSLYAFTRLNGTLAIPSVRDPWLQLENPSLKITVLPQPLFELGTEMNFTVNGKDFDAMLRLILSTTGAAVTAVLKGNDGTLPPPPGIRGLHLREIGMLMGVRFAPPALDLGLQGRYSIGDRREEDDRFALVLQIVQSVPRPMLLSFYMRQITLPEILALFTDVDATQISRELQLIDTGKVSFYWADSPVVLPDGTAAQPGLGFSSTLDLFGFGAHGDFRVDPTSGIHGHAEMEAIRLRGVLEVSGDGRGVQRREEKRNGKWVRVDNRDISRNESEVESREVYVVSPGGPVFLVNTTGSPFFRAAWDIALFEVRLQKVDVSLGTSGLTFRLITRLTLIAELDLACTLLSSGFNASGSLRMGLDLNVGPIKILGVNFGTLRLKALLNGEVRLHISANRFSANINASFDFQSMHFKVPTLRASVPPEKLEDLGAELLRLIEDNAADLFRPLLDAAEAWADLVKAGVLTGIENTARVLKNGYALAEKEAAHILRDLEQDAARVVELMHQAGYVPEKIGAAVEEVYGFSKDQVRSTFRSAGVAVDWMEGAGNDVADWTTGAAGDTADWTTGAADDVAGWTTGAANDVADWTSGAAEDVADAVSNPDTYNPTKW